MDAGQLVSMLNEIFLGFDRAAKRLGLEKIKTIGDAYMAVGGVLESGLPHSIDAGLAALEMQGTVARMKSRGDPSRLPSLELRIGIHTGHAVPAEGAYTGLAVHRAARICAAARGGRSEGNEG